MRALALGLLMVLAACMPDAPQSGNEPGGLWKTTWIAISIDGKAVKPAGAITLTFEDGRAFGRSGCNSYTGGVSISGDTITFGNLASTMMACLDEGVMAQEMAYGTALRGVVRFERPDPKSLVIVNSGGVRIVYSARP